MATTAPASADRRSADTLQPRCYRAHQLPSVLNLSRAFVTRLIASGELQSFKAGRARVIPAEAVERFIADQLAASAER